MMCVLISCDTQNLQQQQLVIRFYLGLNGKMFLCLQMNPINDRFPQKG